METMQVIKTVIIAAVTLVSAYLIGTYLQPQGQQITLRATSQQKSPNIIFIFGDDYGYNDIGYHGSDIKTPVLDQMAADGVKFENYYVQPACTPSRSQLLTGRYQIHTGLQHMVIMPAQANSIPLEMPTIAEKIRDAGYSTHMLGKWHLGFYTPKRIPANRGFDTYLGYYQGASDYWNHSLCFPTYPFFCGQDLHNGSQPVTIEGYSTDIYTNEAIRIINSKKGSDKPMFMYLAYQNTHSPLQAPEEYTKPYEDLPGYNRQPYAGLVASMDESVGKVKAALEDNGMLDNTVIIFSADNGGWALDGGRNAPLRGQKMGLWEGGIKATAFAYGNLVKRQGVVSSELMHVSDWFPTLVNLAGGSVSGLDLDGYDQWSTITAGTPSPRTELLHNIDPMYTPCGTDQFPNTFPTSMQAALRMGDMKLLTGDPGPGDWIPVNATKDQIPGMMDNSCAPPKNYWLFNITADPLEENDLSESNIDTVKTMLDRLQEYQNGAVPVNFPPAFDARAAPARHGGFWEPWLKDSS